VDLRGVNRWIERIAWPMPILSVVLDHLKDATCFATLDACDGYWQWPLHPDSQEILSFQTDMGVFTPRRMLQGVTDGVAAFQAGMSEALGDYLYKIMLLWIDDLLTYAKTIDDLFRNLRLIFEKMRLFGIKLSPT